MALKSVPGFSRVGRLGQPLTPFHFVRGSARGCRGSRAVGVFRGGTVPERIWAGRFSWEGKTAGTDRRAPATLVFISDVMDGA